MHYHDNGYPFRFLQEFFAFCFFHCVTPVIHDRLLPEFFPDFQNHPATEEAKQSTQQVDEGILPTTVAARSCLVQLIQYSVKIGNAKGPEGSSLNGGKGHEEREAEAGKEHDVRQLAQGQAQKQALVGGPDGFLLLLDAEYFRYRVAQIFGDAGVLRREVEDDAHDEDRRHNPEDAPGGFHFHAPSAETQNAPTRICLYVCFAAIRFCQAEHGSDEVDSGQTCGKAQVQQQLAEDEIVQGILFRSSQLVQKFQCRMPGEGVQLHNMHAEHQNAVSAEIRQEGGGAPQPAAEEKGDDIDAAGGAQGAEDVDDAPAQIQLNQPEAAEIPDKREPDPEGEGGGKGFDLPGELFPVLLRLPGQPADIDEQGSTAARLDAEREPELCFAPAGDGEERRNDAHPQGRVQL